MHFEGKTLEFEGESFMFCNLLPDGLLNDSLI